MIKITLDCAAKLIYFRSADWILIPSLSLECGANCHDALPKLTVAINTTVWTTGRNLEFLVAQKLEKRRTELLEFFCFERLEFRDDATLYLGFVLIN